MPSVRGTQDVFFRKTCCEISVFWRMLHDFTRPLEEHIPMLRRNPAYLHGRVCWNSMQVCWIASVIFRVVVFCVRSSAESFLQQQLESWCVWWSWEGVVKYDLIIMMKFQFEHFGGTFLPWSNLTNWFVWLYLHHHKWDCLSLVGSTCHSRFAFILSTCTFLWFAWFRCYSKHPESDMGIHTFVGTWILDKGGTGNSPSEKPIGALWINIRQTFTQVRPRGNLLEFVYRFSHFPKSWATLRLVSKT